MTECCNEKSSSQKGEEVEEVETIDELKSTTLLSYSHKAANELAFKGDGGKKAQKIELQELNVQQDNS